MSSILSWFVDLFTLLPTRVLSILGFGWLTYNGYKAALDAVISHVIENVNSMPGIIYSIASLSGFVTGVGIILSALTAKAALMFIDNLGKIS